MVLRLEAISFAVADVSVVAAFWAGLLDRRVVHESDAALVPGDLTQVGLRFVTSSTKHVARPRLHVHLTSSSPEDQRRTVATALRLGGRHHDVGQTGREGFVVLADPGGNELCVIEPDNNYLAGTGYLGEITCEGGRAVGIFWRDALSWPFVWDQGDQTAIQSPLGGTKIAWDSGSGPEVAPEGEKDRHSFDLTSTDLVADVERLVSLGAVLRTQRSDRVALADPGGNRLQLRPVGQDRLS